MGRLIFRQFNDGDIDEIEAFKAEFIDGRMDGTGALRRMSAKDWLVNIKLMETLFDDDNLVPCMQYALFDDNRLVGTIQIRLKLKGYLVDFGGHIGYCVRPRERRKGYAKYMLSKALKECKALSLDRVMITCLENNIASARTIESCGGVYKKTVFDDVNYQQNMKIYWIESKDFDKQL